MAKTQRMTAGQVKQLINQAVNSVPAKISFSEAESIIANARPGILAMAWSRLVRPVKYKVQPVEDPLKQLDRMEVGNWSTHGHLPKECMLELLASANEQCASVEVKLISFAGLPLKVSEAADLVRRNGYRPAMLSETLAAVLQHEENLLLRHGYNTLSVIDRLYGGYRIDLSANDFDTPEYGSAKWLFELACEKEVTPRDELFIREALVVKA